MTLVHSLIDDALRDRFVAGLKSEAMQKKLLEKTADFNTVCEKAKAMEQADKHAK